MSLLRFLFSGKVSLLTILQGRPSQEAARKVMHLFQCAMKFLQAQRQTFRLKLWKHATRGNSSKADMEKSAELQVKSPYLRDRRH